MRLQTCFCFIVATFEEEKTTRKIQLLREQEEEKNVALLAGKLGLHYANIATFPIEIDALKVISEGPAREGMLAAIQISGKALKIVLRNPEYEPSKIVLGELKNKGYTYDLFLVSAHGLARAWEYYKKIPKEHALEASTIQISNERLQELQKRLTSLKEIKERVEESVVSKTTEALEVILAGALSVDASDIHMETQAEDVRLRFRLDGVLHDVALMQKKFYGLLLSRIKLVSELKLNIHDKAQDGRFTIKTESGNVEVRTSVLPGPEGENVVLRVLNPKAIEVPFEGLGIAPEVITLLETELKKPNGMILTTGPTGSGKTTALYAFLKKVHNPEIKIITLEDPIEYHLKGVEQTQVDTEKGYDFANGLRAIVRQDPDVILVGEIRDGETAETAINAALTGHLVFSTLHTNNAAGAIPRLINLGVKPASIAPALNVAMAQRLLRKLCEACRTPVKLSLKEKEGLKKELSLFPKQYPLPEEKTWTVFKTAPNKCLQCNSTGYKGRIGVFEVILVNEGVEHLILQNPSEYEIQKEAARQGHIIMRQDGLLKILRGVTDFEELDRVVGAA